MTLAREQDVTTRTIFRDIEVLRTELNVLLVQKTAVTDAGLKPLEACKSLTLLSVENTKVTKVGVAALKKALPRLYVQE